MDPLKQLINIQGKEKTSEGRRRAKHEVYKFAFKTYLTSLVLIFVLRFILVNPFSISGSDELFLALFVLFFMSVFEALFVFFIIYLIYRINYYSKHGYYVPLGFFVPPLKKGERYFGMSIFLEIIIYVIAFSSYLSLFLRFYF